MWNWLAKLLWSKEERARRAKEYREAVARIEARDRREREAERIREAKERKAEAKRNARQRKAKKRRTLKAAKKLNEKIRKAKAFAKAKGLRRTRRDGQTVYVNRDGNIVNYMILYYLLFHTNNETYGRDSDYYTPVVSNVHEEFGGYSGGSSGGGGASSSWDSGSSYDSGSSFSGSFGGGDSGGGGASGSF